jgi:hypothetical protein
MPTHDGDKHVKFSWTSGREGPYTPANEAIGPAVIQIFGIARPACWLVDVPLVLAATSPEMTDLRSHTGLGTDWLAGGVIELSGPQIAAEAANAPRDELLVQQLVMNWVQVGDHSHNFVQDGIRVIAVDFATGPPTAVWDGAALSETITDHGDLAAILASAPADVRDDVTARFDQIGEADLKRIFDPLPGEWVTVAQSDHVIAELLRTKGAIRAVLKP